MFSKCCNALVKDEGCTGCMSWCPIEDQVKEKLPVNTYIVKVPYSGYSRGDDVYHIEATSEENAEYLVKQDKGEFIEREICRDDTDSDVEHSRCYGIVENKIKN